MILIIVNFGNVMYRFYEGAVEVIPHNTPSPERVRGKPSNEDRQQAC